MEYRKYNAIEAGELFLSEFTNQRKAIQGSVIGSFPGVWNIKIDRVKGFSIVNTNKVMAPYHLRLKHNINIKNGIMGGIQPGSKVLINRDKIWVRGERLTYLISTTECHPAFTSLTKNSDNKLREDSLIKIRFKNYLKQQKNGALSQELYHRFKCIYDLNKEHIKNEILWTLGRGPGLTPAGDDFLVGWLSYLKAIETHRFYFFQKLIKTIDIFKCTTFLSALQIKGALKGHFNQYIIKLFKSLKLKNEIKKSVKMLLNHGSSSGRDMFIGILTGFFSD